MGGRYGDRVHVVELDVTDDAQVRDAVAVAEEHFGGIDVLVNNAGRGWYGSIEGMRRGSVRAMFELNFFAVLSVTRAVLPGCALGAAAGSSTCRRWRACGGDRVRLLQRHQVRGRGRHRGVARRSCGTEDHVMAVEPGSFRTRAYAGFAGEQIRRPCPTTSNARAGSRRDDRPGRAQPGDPRRGVRAVIAAMAQEPPPRRLVLGSDSSMSLFRRWRSR